MAKFLVALFCLFVLGCASTPSVDDTDSVRSALAMRCKDFDLTQDCSFWSGAKRRIVIEDVLVRVAGSTDGETVLIMDAKFLENISEDMYDLRQNRSSLYINKSYMVVKKLLAKHNIEILETIRLGRLDKIYGYVIITNEDSYAILLSEGKEPDSTR